MEVNVSCDLRQLMADSRKASRAFRHAFGELVDLAYWTFEKLIDLTPKSGRSREGDRVADSWELKFQRYVLWRELEWSTLSDNKIVGYLEYGTRDHWIYPKVAKMLHWIDPDTGEDCFSAGHVVSGIKPVGMIRKTETEIERELQRIQAKTAMKISN
jgi:hypothetical protein